MSRIPITICIIAKNEEKHMVECLKRIHSYGFEIIVTDTGSTDSTKKLAAYYANQVLDFEWIDDFSAARNYCASHATNDWILALDCDEYISSIQVEELLQLIKTYPKLTGALPLKHLIQNEDGTQCYTKDIVPRLYNKKYYSFQKPIHEQLFPQNMELLTNAQSFLLPIKAVHYGYALSSEEMRIKQERNLSLLYKQLEQEGMSSYICFQIGQSELILKNTEKAIYYFEKGLSFSDSPTLLYVREMILSLAKAYVMSERRTDALKLMEQYESLCDSAKYVFFHANVLMDNQEYLKALIKYVKATMMLDTDMLGDELLYCYQHIIDLYHKFGEDELAKVFIEKYQNCLQEKS